VAVVGGRVRGTWKIEADELRVAWFGEAGKPPRNAVRAEVARIASILDRDLRPVIGLV
jgi:hypothetical protein